MDINNIILNEYVIGFFFAVLIFPVLEKMKNFERVCLMRSGSDSTHVSLDERRERVGERRCESKDNPFDFL